ncbi:MAG: alkane 1-monooxygenase [Paracoccus sp. (in: a-proteobacteria)]|nr:alkane 1-monooxygenase [Paracoccus sp. (in: a-proteobacteria)]
MARLWPRGAPLAGFALAGLLPGGLLILGAWLGGAPLWAGLALMALAAPLADTIAAPEYGDRAEPASSRGADLISVLLAALHFALLASVLVALARPDLPWHERAALIIGAGMFFGQSSNANAHELIHRSRRFLFRLGAAIYLSLLFGHHVSAHRLVHHRFVATDADPNSARLGESFWAFWPRAWVGSFRAGLAAERALTARQPGRLNPYLIWTLGAALLCAAILAAFGPRAFANYLLLCAYAQMQLFLSDYVQHYGLRRAETAGRPEPVAERHSWDAPHAISSLLMVNAPRHSDHHAHPARAYPSLRLNRAEARPMLPYSLPVMGALAMIPPLWRRIMDRRVAQMRERS